MCFEWKNRFLCGHIGFNRVERCALLGMGCFGPDGSEKYLDVETPCYDCRAKQGLPDPREARANDPYRKRSVAPAPAVVVGGLVGVVGSATSPAASTATAATTPASSATSPAGGG